MARRSMLTRMETVCSEVMEMPEIFLAEEDEDGADNDEPMELDELNEPEADDASQNVEHSDNEKTDGSSKLDEKSGQFNKVQGVSIEINCDDKENRRVGKWISRALRTAVNPIVSRFNLRLKVLLDFDVAKDGKQAEPDKPKPRQADLERMKKLEKENRQLEKYFEKIVSCKLVVAYVEMKAILTEKCIEYDKLQEKHFHAETRIAKHIEDTSKLESDNAHLKCEISMLQEELKQEKIDKMHIIRQTEDKLKEMQEKKQNSLDEKALELEQLNATFQKLQANFKQTDRNHDELNQRVLNLENKYYKHLKCDELTEAKSCFQMMEKILTQNAYNFSCKLCRSSYNNSKDLEIHNVSCDLVQPRMFPIAKYVICNKN